MAPHRIAGRVRLGFALLVATGGWADGHTPATVEEIVKRSVENTNANWAAAPRYAFTERDIVTRGGDKHVRKYEVMMIEGSPYEKLLAEDGRPLSGAQAANEERKLRQEIERRRKESAAERQKRIAGYQRERREDHALMNEMVEAFDFKLLGEETMDGRRCFALAATPRPGYQPKSRYTKALTGMRGKMWIDAEEYQWVRVEAKVFRPVAFGLFIAHVEPGTEFVLEQKPVEGRLWLPSHFSTRVRATVLFLSRNSSDDETYTDYHPAGMAEAAGAEQ